MADNEGSEFKNLHNELGARLQGWIKRAAKLTRDNAGGYASITFTLRDPGGDEDNTLVVEAVVEEKFVGETVEGARFDTAKSIGAVKP